MRKIQHESFTHNLGGFFKNDGAQKHVLNSPPGKFTGNSPPRLFLFQGNLRAPPQCTPPKK